MLHIQCRAVVVPTYKAAAVDHVAPFSVRVLLTVLEEGGVKMKLTVVDTPGFGDQINNDNW